MTMTACRECAGAVSATAPACPSCGARNPAPSRHRSRSNRQAVLVFGLFVLVLALLYFA